MCEGVLTDTTVVDDVLTTDSQGLLDEYDSRPRQLARWLLISRDTLRAKYRAVKVEMKRLKVRVADVSGSRDKWRQRAEFSEQQLRAMQAEVERLSALISQDEGVKKKATRSEL